MVATFCPDKLPAQWDWGTLFEDYRNQFNLAPQLPAPETPELKQEMLVATLKEQVQKRLAEREEEFTLPVMESLLRILLLQTIDMQWKGHLLSIDHLKEGIGLRSYGQRNPKEEYKREAYNLFIDMMGRIRQESIQKLFRVQLARDEDVERMEEEQRRKKAFLDRHSGSDGFGKTVKRDERIGRNDPCPCGSGKKYKKCCGQGG